MLFLPILFFFCQSTFAATEDPSDQVTWIDPPLLEEATRFEGSAGYELTAIEHYRPGSQGWLGLISTKNDAIEPGVRFDFLNRFKSNELKAEVSSQFKNEKRQSLKVAAHLSPGSKIFPRWGGEIGIAAPVYGRPLDLSVGFHYSSYVASTVALLFPGFNAYFFESWMFSAQALGSKVTAHTVHESKWLLGYALKLTKFYSDENSIGIYFSKNEESTYSPVILDYSVVPVTTLGLSWQHWVTPQAGLAPIVEWQKKAMDPYRNWLTLGLNFLFKI